MADTLKEPKSIMGRVALTVRGQRLDVEVRIPDGKLPLSAMLPVFRSVAENFVDMGVAGEAKAGRNVSCQKGCGACCRQLVPISAIEAREVAKVVERMPPGRKAVIEQRFADARQKLADAEMLDPLLHPDLYSDEQMRALGRQYFRLGIPCPFLEDESCSIYPDRPITCREYLVTSPAINCAAPTPETVKVVPLVAGPVWAAVARLEPEKNSRFIRWVPLILALEFAESAEPPPTARAGKEWVEEFFRRITRDGKARM